MSPAGGRGDDSVPAPSDLESVMEGVEGVRDAGDYRVAGFPARSGT